jgi:DNA-binding NarL/FixJ family response regulator
MSSQPKVRVLIVDDQALFADALKELLDRDPDLHVIGVAYSGQDAIDVAATEHPDVVLMDVAMPTMDGFQAARLIRALRAATQVIAVSGYEQDAIAAEAEAAGMVAVLSKDRIADHIRAAIDAACARPPG